MARILRNTDGIKKGTIIGAAGNIYQVYQTPVENGIRISAGVRGGEDLESVTLAPHQVEQADELFDKFCAIFGGGKTNIDLADYQRIDLEEEEEEEVEVVPEEEAPEAGGDDA